MRLLFPGRLPGAPRAILRAARSAGAEVRAVLLELADASEFAALPRRRDERVYAHKRGAHPVAGPEKLRVEPLFLAGSAAGVHHVLGDGAHDHVYVDLGAFGTKMRCVSPKVLLHMPVEHRGPVNVVDVVVRICRFL